MCFLPSPADSISQPQSKESAYDSQNTRCQFSQLSNPSDGWNLVFASAMI